MEHRLHYLQMDGQEVFRFATHIMAAGHGAGGQEGRAKLDEVD